MSEVKRSNMIEYLKKKTDYNYKYLINLTDLKLYGIYCNICNYIYKYINEILTYQDTHFLLSKYSKYELEQMTYGDLISIRKKYGIGINKKKIIHEENEDVKEDVKYEDMEYLTYEELYEMYGDEGLDYSDCEMSNNGIIIDRNSTSNIKKKQHKDEIKEAIINFIIRAKLKDNLGKRYKREDLEKKYFEDIRRIYEVFCETNNNKFPEYYEITKINALYKRK